MNNFFVSGRLGSDAELRYLANGTAVCELSIADTQKKGETFVTSWWKVTLWARTAEEWAPHLKKGNEVAACGRMSQRTWKDKEQRTQIANSLDEINWFRGCWRPERQEQNQQPQHSNDGPGL